MIRMIFNVVIIVLVVMIFFVDKTVANGNTAASLIIMTECLRISTMRQKQLDLMAGVSRKMVGQLCQNFF